jgi:hypothetical protein
VGRHGAGQADDAIVTRYMYRRAVMVLPPAHGARFLGGLPLRDLPLAAGGWKPAPAGRQDHSPSPPSPAHPAPLRRRRLAGLLARGWDDAKVRQRGASRASRSAMASPRRSPTRAAWPIRSSGSRTAWHRARRAVPDGRDARAPAGLRVRPRGRAFATLLAPWPARGRSIPPSPSGRLAPDRPITHISSPCRASARPRRGRWRASVIRPYPSAISQAHPISPTASWFPALSVLL